MQEPIDELYGRWRSSPGAFETIALCDALRGSPRAELVDIVGAHAAQQPDAPTLIAAARMYARVGRLDDAQRVLVTAGRVAPREGEVYRWLGEILLRRGDAQRAEKVLERAVALGAKDPATSRWLDRARSLVPTQQAESVAAVAEEVTRVASDPSLRARPPSTPKTAPAPGDDDDEVETLVRKQQEVKPGFLGAARPPLHAPAAGRPPMPSEDATASAPAPAPPTPAFGRALGPVLGQPTMAGIGDASRALAPPREAGPFASPQTRDVAWPAEAASATPPARAHAVTPLPPARAQARAQPAAAPPQPARAAEHGPSAMPEARDVLEALQIAGIFEPESATRPQPLAWDKPAQGKRRAASFIALFGLAGFAIGGAGGVYHHVTTKRAKQHVEAERLLAKLDSDLAASDARLLAPSESGLTKAFDLDSRSPHAALTWLHERGMVGLLEGGENVAFEDAIVRAKEVGVAEKHLAFAHVASFLFQGDTAGAAAALAKWDARAGDDAWYQLVAGATFDRAGDGRALERYAAAVKLAPQLVVAQLLLARATAVDGDPLRAAEQAKEFRARHPDRIEGAALVTLAWARDPLRGDPPAEAKEIADKIDVLPTPLKAVAPAARALIAIEQRRTDEAKAALEKALTVADTPGVAAWLGNIALGMGDEALARRGALAAVSFSAIYPPARMLAARVALRGARLDEALKAVEELPPASADVGVVAAAVAYEKLDGDRMKTALDALPDEARKLPLLAPLVRGQALLFGSAPALGTDAALEMAEDETPWADLVAMDAALDAGDLELARKIAGKWRGAPQALRAVRLSKLARWEGRSDEADRLSRAALEGGTVTVRALAERTHFLVATGRAAEAGALLKAYPNVGGPLARWLRAHVLAAQGKLDEARAILGAEDPPSALAPLPARTIAAMAYGAAKDSRRGGAYVKALLSAGAASPDVVTAAEKVGASKPARRR